MARRMVRLPPLMVVALLFASAAVLLAGSKEAEATFPGKNGTIAYVARGWLYTINPSGGGKTKVTQDWQLWEPSCSPDANTIAYRRWA
jgi:hypothetical protein